MGKIPLVLSIANENAFIHCLYSANTCNLDQEFFQFHWVTDLVDTKLGSQTNHTIVNTIPF